jgi:ABC-type sulfate transport system substrate-binding protein
MVKIDPSHDGSTGHAYALAEVLESDCVTEKTHFDNGGSFDRIYRR